MPRPLTTPQSRRRFLAVAGGSTAATLFASRANAASPTAAATPTGATERYQLAFVGLNSRGTDLLQSFLATRQVTASWLVDVDTRAIAKAAGVLKGRQDAPFRSDADLRRALEDPQLHGVVIATPDHWHATATLLALKAGKQVYVEKPLSHTPHEGEAIVAAAARHGAVVQVGLQRRSVPWVADAVRRIQDGALGEVHFVRAWYAARRASIGKGRTVPVPDWLNYDLWQGPAPERPFRDNVVHYQWHWFWHWGTGELANNGVHFLDVVRWALQLDHPTRVTSAGGRYFFDDDHETPDTQTVTFEFPGRTVVWEHRSCQPTPSEGEPTGVAFYGRRGTLILGAGGFRVLDLDGRETARVEGGTPTEPHAEDFLACLRDRTRTPHAPAIEGHRSTLLCHLGNIAQRSGRVVEVDPTTGRLRDPQLAREYWSREYRPGWELPG